jgi:hypothetical protein
VAMVGGEYARDDSGVVRYGEEREREFRAILKSSTQDTIDSSLDLCKNFLDRKWPTIRDCWQFPVKEIR